jgi:hypothetical protein
MLSWSPACRRLQAPTVLLMKSRGDAGVVFGAYNETAWKEDIRYRALIVTALPFIIIYIIYFKNYLLL